MEEFEPRRGGLLLLLLRDGEPVAGGPFRRFDEQTATPRPPGPAGLR